MASPRVSTIADIARLAGVSKSTVSRALNDSPLIGPDTKERIREIAREHRFQMNDSARRLSLRQSNVVALVTYAYKADVKVPDTFMLEMMSGISAIVAQPSASILSERPGPELPVTARRPEKENPRA